MKLSKKAIATYIFAILGASIGMTILFLLVSDVLYSQEHADCVNVEFKITDACITARGYSFGVANRGEVPFDFLINGENRQSLLMGEVKKLTPNGDKIKISPFVLINNEMEFCKSKNQQISEDSTNKRC